MEIWDHKNSLRCNIRDRGSCLFRFQYLEGFVILFLLSRVARTTTVLAMKSCKARRFSSVNMAVLNNGWSLAIMSSLNKDP